MEEKNQILKTKNETSINELIQILIEGRKFIIGITLIALIISGIYSYFIVDDKYEAEAILLTSPININFEETNNLDDISGLVAQYPTISIETYIELIKSSQLLNKTILELDMRDGSGELIKYRRLLSMLRVTNISGTNLIVISVTNSDPELAQNIANTLGENFTELIYDNNREISFDAVRVIEEKLLSEEANLEEISKKYIDYINQNGDIQALKNEVNTLLKNINDYQSDLIFLEREIDSGTLALNTLLESYNIEIGSNLVELDYTIDDNFEVIEEIKLDLSDTNSIQDALIQVEITKIETKLISDLAKFTSISQNLDIINSRYTEKQSVLAKNTIEYDRISRELSLSRQAFNTYQEMHKEVIETSSGDLNNSGIIVSSYAERPDSPIYPDKKLNLVIGLIFGLLVGIIIAYIKYLWYDSVAKMKANS